MSSGDAQSTPKDQEQTATELKKQRIAKVRTRIADCGFQGFLGGSNSALQIDWRNGDTEKVRDCVKSELKKAGIPFTGSWELTVQMVSIEP